jgi:hypothetical protein
MGHVTKNGWIYDTPKPMTWLVIIWSGSKASKRCCKHS